MIKKVFFGTIAISIAGILIYWYGIKTEYYFETTFYQKDKSGDYEPVIKTEEFLIGISDLGLEKKLSSQGEHSVKMTINNHELNKIINSNKTKPYINSYKKVKDMGPGVNCGRPECIRK